MGFVVVKSKAAQAAAIVFRTRDLLVRRRTQIINALRGHLAEYGIPVAKGPAQVSELVTQLEDPANPAHEVARPILDVPVAPLRGRSR